jgi:Caspase domain
VNVSQESGPGLHAFLVGISDYPFLPTETESARPGKPTLGLQKLSSAALSAYSVYQWLDLHKEKLSVPLRSRRLLVVPSASEKAAIPALGELASRADLDAFTKLAVDWRNAANSNPENITLFYFSGHGVQRKFRDHVLLLENFGKGGPLLKDALDTATLIDGMAPGPDSQSIARTQFYFLDACRLDPEEFQDYESMEVTPLWDVYRCKCDDRVAAVFHTAEPGRAAYGVPGGPSLFCEALMKCLSGGGGVQSPGIRSNESTRWNVTLSSLSERLNHYLAKISKRQGVNQRCLVQGVVPGIVVVSLDGPPMVEITLRVSPGEARQCSTVRFLDALERPVWETPLPIEPHPYRDSVIAGEYKLSWTSHNERYALRDNNFRFISIAPPECPLMVEFPVL